MTYKSFTYTQPLACHDKELIILMTTDLILQATNHSYNHHIPQAGTSTYPPQVPVPFTIFQHHSDPSLLSPSIHLPCPHLIIGPSGRHSARSDMNGADRLQRACTPSSSSSSSSSRNRGGKALEEGDVLHLDSKRRGWGV